MLIPCDEVNILNTFRVMIILRLLLLLTNLHLKLLSTQGTGADKLLSTERVKICVCIEEMKHRVLWKLFLFVSFKICHKSSCYA